MNRQRIGATAAVLAMTVIATVWQVPGANASGVADLSVAMSDSPDPYVDAVYDYAGIRYTVTIVNNGPDPATDVRLKIVNRRAGVWVNDWGYWFGTATQGECEPIEVPLSRSNGLRCALATLASGATATVQAWVGYCQPGLHRVEASVSASEADPFSLNDRATELTVDVPLDRACPA
jgi:hypothetical protein